MHVQRNMSLIGLSAFLTSMRFAMPKNLQPSPPWPLPSPRLPCCRRCPQRPQLSFLLFPLPSPSPPLPFLLLPHLVDCCLIVVNVAIAVSVAVDVATAAITCCHLRCFRGNGHRYLYLIVVWLYELLGVRAYP